MKEFKRKEEKRKGGEKRKKGRKGEGKSPNAGINP